MDTGFYFNWVFFKRFFKQLGVIFPKFCCPSTLLFLGLICIVILEQVATYFIGLIPSYYYTILGEKKLDEFWKRTGISLSLITIMACILATKKYVWMLFYIKSREMLTKLLQDLYTSNINFYKLNVLDSDVDNVDQRITQDVEKMCRTFGEIIPSLIVTPFNIIYYSYAAWSVSGYVGPVTVYIFFAFSTLINKFLMSPIVDCAAFQEKSEGEFRYKHMHLRLNSESAAFYRCGPTENAKLREKLDQLINSQKRLNNKQFFLSLSVNGATYFGSILSYIIIAIPIFNGAYDDLKPAELSALISKSSFLILYLIFNFTRLIEMAPEVANMAGCSHRIGQLYEELSFMEANNKKKDDDDGVVVTVTENISFCNGSLGKSAYNLIGVSVRVAHKAVNHKLLCRDLTLDISAGRSLIITGDSGIGKTSLLRTLDGLWPLQNGKITRLMNRGRGGIFYLPQKPYLTSGSLRQQIIFPDLVSTVSEDDEIIKNLQVASLEELLSRAGNLDNSLDWHWEDILSPGESQRLAFVRLFYHKPAVAILDEATSQVSEDLERVLYENCKKIGITLVSIGHRKSLKKFHDQELKLLPAGNWSLAWQNHNRHGHNPDAGGNWTDSKFEGYEGMEGEDMSSLSDFAEEQVVIKDEHQSARSEDIYDENVEDIECNLLRTRDDDDDYGSTRL